MRPLLDLRFFADLPKFLWFDNGDGSSGGDGTGGDSGTSAAAASSAAADAANGGGTVVTPMPVISCSRVRSG